MFTLAMRSVRHRPGRLIGTLLAATLGAAIAMAFNSLHDTAAAGVDDTSAMTLGLAGGVVGGYGTLLVFFTVASTLTVNVRQRGEELGTLRRAGATPAQLTRMVTGEALVVAVVSTLLAIGPAALGGSALLRLFQDTDQVAADVDYVFGPIALSAGFSVTLLASAGAAFVAVRRAARAAAGQRRRRGRARTVGGVAALVTGSLGAPATLMMDASDEMLMAPASYGAILLSIGFAAFSAPLLRGLLRCFGGLVAALTGAGGYLAVRNLRRRADQLGGILMPLILFTGIATATLYMQVVESDALEAAGLMKSADDKNLVTINVIVAGIIVAFCCFSLVNSLYAETSYRSGEFGRQRLTGATRWQVLTMVATESVLVTVTGLFFGTAAGLAGLIPFCVVRTDRMLPEQGPWIWLGVAAVGALATLVTSLVTARRALRKPAVAAVAVAA